MYKAGKIKLEFKSSKMDLTPLMGPSFDEAKSPGDACDYDKAECNIDFMNMYVIVVYPYNNQEEVNSLSFSYTLTDAEDIDDYRKFYVKNFTGADGRRMLYIVGACIALFICIVVCSICVCSYYCCCKPKVHVDPDTGRRFSRRRSSKGSSLRASMRRSMRLESFVSRSNQSFRRTSTKKAGLNDMSPPRGAKIIRLNDEEA